MWLHVPAALMGFIRLFIGVLFTVENFVTGTYLPADVLISDLQNYANQVLQGPGRVIGM